MLSLSACASAPTSTAAIKVKVAWPQISAEYQQALQQAGPGVSKMALQHELDWQGYALQMEGQ